MTRMAAYEESDGASDRKITSYFRGDYLTRQILITVFCSTFAFLLLAAMYAVYHFEALVLEIYSADLRELAVRVLTIYLVFIGVMSVITIVVYMLRYSRAHRHIGGYYHDLGELSVEYHRESLSDRKG